MVTILNKLSAKLKVSVTPEIQKQIASLFLVAALFALPMSSTAKSILVALALISILCVKDYRIQLAKLCTDTWVLSIAGLLSVVVLASFWGPAPYTGKLYVLEKYSKLLYIPIFAVAFQARRVRFWGLNAYLLAMLITALIAILKTHGFLSSFNFDPNRVFRNHIIIGLMSAFAAYSSLWFYRKYKGVYSIPYLALAFIFTYHVLFINSGRTGYVIYAFLMMLFVFQNFTLKNALLGIALIISLLLTVFFISPVMKHEVRLVAQDIVQYKHNQKDTRVGYRLQFHDFAHNLFNRHPLRGNGTSSFTYIFAKENPVPGWGHGLLEPHSQYWLVAAEFGLLGLGALFFFYISLVGAIWKLHEMRQVAFAVLFCILLGSYSDSLIFYSGPGYFFVLIIALCLGEGVKPRKSNL